MEKHKSEYLSSHTNKKQKINLAKINRLIKDKSLDNDILFKKLIKLASKPVKPRH
jgi:ribosomal protein L18E